MNFQQEKTYLFSRSPNTSRTRTLRAIALACGKDSVYFTLKTYFFYFTPSLLQNIHISFSILQYISIKYSFFSIFLLFLSTTL